jgi:hypothetical protein
MLNIFLPFPQTDDTISKIILDENSYKRFVKEYLETISAISKESSVKLFYDSDNIRYFIDACKKFENEHYLNEAENQIRKFIPQNSNDIQNKTIKDGNCIYVLWNSNKSPCVEQTSKIIEEIAERIICYQNEKFILFNISENIETDRDVLLVCKDARHILDLPKFARIPYITDKYSLDLWLATNHIVEFSLLNKSCFTSTKKIEQGQRVYKEIKADRYWYLDNLHKDHYEVFDSNGEYIGKANLRGEINKTKKSRRIKL